MKATELRIGNWVFNKAHERKQVKEVYADCSIYDPIPLTEEWLLRFGYESKDYGWHGKWHVIDEFTENVFTCDKTGVNIKYVHQFQNLYFALTGEEL